MDIRPHMQRGRCIGVTATLTGDDSHELIENVLDMLYDALPDEELHPVCTRRGKVISLLQLRHDFNGGEMQRHTPLTISWDGGHPNHTTQVIDVWAELGRHLQRSMETWLLSDGE